MQSLRQYRQLGRRLRQQYVPKKDSSMALSTVQKESTQKNSSHCVPVESQQLEKIDLESGNTTRTPSIINGSDNADRISTRSLTLTPSLTLSMTLSSDGPNVTSANNFSGISVQDRIKPGDSKSTVFVVEQGDDDADMNARNWRFSLKLWAT